MAAALTAGIVDGLITYPVETLKIRMQIASRKKPAEAPAPAPAAKGAAAAAAAAATAVVPAKVTMMGTARQIWSEGGIAAFYPGIAYHLMGEITKSVWRYTLFEGVKKAYMRHFGSKTGEASVRDNVIISTLSATGETFLVVQPWDRLKIMGIGGASPLKAIQDVYSREGLAGVVKSVYKGLDMTWIRQLGNNVSAFTTFYWLKNMTLKMNPGRKTLTPAEKFIYGGLGGCIGSVFTMPVDAIKSIKQKEVATGGRGSLAIARDIYTREGLSAFWRGTTARASLLFLKRAISFYCYETVLEFLAKAK